MADPEIRVSVTASTQAATAQLENFGERSKAAMEAYNAAAAKGKTVSEALGKAFDEAMTSGLGFTEAMEAATAAVTANTAATERAAAATSHAVPQFAAASGALRTLEGNFSHNIRAAERFLSTTLGLGPVLQAAFPVVGAIAFAGVLFEMGKSAYEAYEKFIDLDGATKKLTDDFQKLQEKDFLDVKSIETANERLDQATQKATNLRNVAESLHEVSLKGFFGDLLSGNTTAAGADIGLLVSAKRFADDSVKSTEQSIALGLKKLELEHETTRLRIEAQHAADGALQGEARINAQLQEQLALHRENAEYEKRREKALGNAAPQNAGSEQEALEDQIARGRAAAERAALERKPDQTHKLVAEMGLDEAREKLQQLKQETRDLEETFNSAIEAPFKEIAHTEEMIRRDAEANARAYRERAQAAAETAQQVETEANAQHAIAVAQIQAAEATGQLSKAGADHAKAAADAELYRQKLEALQQELAQLIPFSEQYERVLRQIQQVQGQQQVSQIQNQTRTAQDIASPFLKATDSINQAWLQMQNKLIFGTRFVGQAFANMGVSMLESVAASFEKMLVRQLQYEIQSRIAHQTSNTLKVASDAQAAAAGQVIHQESALKEEFINAKTAATGAFKGVMSAVLPPINAILAPVAAAAAFTGTLAVGAFAQGGIITGPTLAMMGEAGEEAVLPNNLTKMLVSAANNYSSSSSTSSTVVNHTSNFNGLNDRTFREYARRNADHVADAVSSSVRRGSRRVA